LLDAAETVLGYCGFDANVYRKSENGRNYDQQEEMVEWIERWKKKRYVSWKKQLKGFFLPSFITMIVITNTAMALCCIL
jgi:hypothetical protein